MFRHSNPCLIPCHISRQLRFQKELVFPHHSRHHLPPLQQFATLATIRPRSRNFEREGCGRLLIVAGDGGEVRHETGVGEVDGEGFRLASVRAQAGRISDDVNASGTIQDGNIKLSKEGIRVVSQMQTATPAANGNLSLSDLEIVKMLGRGSSSVVRLVKHKWTNETYALKEIFLKFEETMRRQIVQELKINHESRCPCIVVCYHAFYNNGLISIVLEYMDGGSLADIMKELEPKCIREPNLAVVSKQKDPNCRPSAAELLKHPFMNKYDEVEHGLVKLLPPLFPLA